MSIELKVDQKEGASIFALSGRLDSSTAPTVEEKIIQSIQSGTHNVILDFAALDYISSAGIRVLVHCHKELEKKQGKILLVSVPKPIENVLYITGFLPYFKIYDGQSQAIEALKK